LLSKVVLLHTDIAYIHRPTCCQSQTPPKLLRRRFAGSRITVNYTQNFSDI